MQKNYYAIIPANVRYDPELTPNAKLLYGEITALCNEKGYCWASNSYFSELYGVSKVSISKWIKQLTEKGYINSEIQYKGGTKEIFNRYLRIVNDPIKEKLNTPIKEKFKDNTTSFNTTSNNTKEYPFVEIVNYLNDVSGKTYKSSTKKTQSLIRARFEEGFTKDDFFRVIDKKYAQWKDDPNMKKYIRPETLFGTKFEGYLNEEGGTHEKRSRDFEQQYGEYNFDQERELEF